MSWPLPWSTAGQTGTVPLPLLPQASYSDQACGPDLPAPRALCCACGHCLRDRRLGGNQRYLPQAAPAGGFPVQYNPCQSHSIPSAHSIPMSMASPCSQHLLLEVSPACSNPRMPGISLLTASPFYGVFLPIASPCLQHLSPLLSPCPRHPSSTSSPFHILLQ